jgi:hypothetical protein
MMNRRMPIEGMLALALLVVSSPSRAQSNSPPAAPQFKAVFWYERADPSATLKSKVYDLRRGNYDAEAVAAWLKTVRTDYPAFAALERTVDLTRVPGATEEEKLVTAIEQERARIVGRPPVQHLPVPSRPANPARAAHSQASGGSALPIPTLRSVLHPDFGPGRDFPSRFGPGPSRLGDSPIRGTSPLSPPAPSFPHPYPYPRPHP